MKDHKPSVLIVEDELPIRTLLMVLLGDRFHCQAAETAGEAMQLLNSQFFHLVVADIGLPGISGLELCRTIVAHSPQTVVVLISGQTDSQAAGQARMAGAFDFLSKPFDLAEVTAIVERAMAHQASQSKPNSAVCNS